VLWVWKAFKGAVAGDLASTGFMEIEHMFWCTRTPSSVCILLGLQIFVQGRSGKSDIAQAAAGSEQPMLPEVLLRSSEHCAAESKPDSYLCVVFKTLATLLPEGLQWFRSLGKLGHFYI
jgi:hypothetical protein